MLAYIDPHSTSASLFFLHRKKHFLLLFFSTKLGSKEKFKSSKEMKWYAFHSCNSTILLYIFNAHNLIQQHMFSTISSSAEELFCARCCGCQGLAWANSLKKKNIKGYWISHSKSLSKRYWQLKDYSGEASLHTWLFFFFLLNCSTGAPGWSLSQPGYQGKGAFCL